MTCAVSLFLDVLHLTAAILVLCYRRLVFSYPHSVGPIAQVARAAVMRLFGPNILLLLPCWLLGVLAFRLGDIAMSRGVAIVLAALAAALLVFIVLRVSPLPLSTMNAPLFFSSRFLTDWLIAALIAAMLVFARRAVADLEIAAPITGFARRLADQTFPLYLFHHPILLFIAALVPFDHGRPLQVLTVVAVMLAVIACLGSLCDASRGWWRQVFETGLRRLSGRRDSMHPLSK